MDIYDQMGQFSFADRHTKEAIMVNAVTQGKKEDLFRSQGFNPDEGKRFFETHFADPARRNIIASQVSQLDKQNGEPSRYTIFDQKTKQTRLATQAEQKQKWKENSFFDQEPQQVARGLKEEMFISKNTEGKKTVNIKTLVTIEQMMKNKDAILSQGWRIRNEVKEACEELIKMSGEKGSPISKERVGFLKKLIATQIKGQPKWTAGEDNGEQKEVASDKPKPKT